MFCSIGLTAFAEELPTPAEEVCYSDLFYCYSNNYLRTYYHDYSFETIETMDKIYIDFLYSDKFELIKYNFLYN